MDPFLEDRMEDYLAGRLSGADRERFETLLAEDSDAGGIVEGFRDTSALFEAITVPEDEMPTLDAAFYARLRQKIDKEDEIPFWAALLGWSGQTSRVVLPSLMASRSASVLRCLGAGTSVASTI